MTDDVNKKTLSANNLVTKASFITTTEKLKYLMQKLFSTQNQLKLKIKYQTFSDFLNITNVSYFLQKMDID